VRLKTSPALRRLVPTPLVIRRTERKAALVWDETPGARESARACIEAIVAGTARAHEVEKLARAHFIEEEVRRNLFWHPWRFDACDEQSVKHLRDALSADTGTVVSWTHLGFFYKAGRGVVELGHDLYRVTGPWFLETPSNDAWGRRLGHWRNMLTGRHDLWVSAKGSYELLARLLEAGKAVAIAFDVPGTRDTRFLGKQVMLADGTARLAAETGARIVPTRAVPKGARFTQEYAPALDPRELGGAEELHRALAAVHERWILDAPTALEDPRRPGFWEDGATPLAWKLPSRRTDAA
jgi:lauroyl/myristoyl acyltransferase